MTVLERILRKRGLTKAFLRPDYEALFDPFLMRGMPEAVARIERAREAGEQIVIYGDYDADGVTAALVMETALRDFGCRKVAVLLPDRFADGFGLKTAAVPKILAQKATLVITVDNGSTAGEAAEQLKTAGVDLIITDHHAVPAVLPVALAVINPCRADESHGAGLAGVGVAFMTARALNMRKRANASHAGRGVSAGGGGRVAGGGLVAGGGAGAGRCDGQEKWLLDLVTIGTLCDVMPLNNELNRTLTYWGLKVLQKTRRKGLTELAMLAQRDLTKADGFTVGYQIGPRLNAAGRMERADLAYALLKADGRAEAVTLAQRLEKLNQQRRTLQEQIIREAEASVVPEDPVVVVRGDWHEGVAGIAAGELLERRQRPALVLTRLPDGTLKGSGRSFGEFSLIGALNAVDDLLTGGGGHDSACGVALKEENFDAFRQRVNAYYRSLKLQNQAQFLAVKSDLKLTDFAEMTPETFEALRQLEPFGEGNAEPLFEIRATVAEKRIYKDKHLCLELADGEGRRLRMMAFDAPEAWKQIPLQRPQTVLFNLALDEWRGVRRAEGRIRALEA